MTRDLVPIIFALLLIFAGCARQLSERDVFQRAAVAANSADASSRWYIFSEIAKAEAEHGHYDDALQGWKLSDKFPDQLFGDIVAIRARNGDIPGAKKMADRAASEDGKRLALYAIALAQAELGDAAGARENIRSLPLRFQLEVLQAIGTQQARSGDLQAALQTASEMERGWSDGVLFEVAKKFAALGDKTRAHKIAMRMAGRNRTWSAGGATAPLSPPSGTCDIGMQGSAGNSDQLSKRLNDAKCDCRTLSYIHEKSGDWLEAEKAMLRCPNPANVSAGMAELASRSAAKGNIDAAIKLAEAVHVTGAEFEEGYLAPALRTIAKNWAVKDSPAALRWAEARPDGYQRAMALLGVAEVMRSRQGKP